MAKEMNTPDYTVEAGEALEQYRLVKLNASNAWVYADSGDEPVGRNNKYVASGDPATATLFNKCGTMKMVASGAISARARVYTDNDGKITATNTGISVGVNGETASTADGDIIEIFHDRDVVSALSSPEIAGGINDVNGNELLKFTATATAVNEITLANAATGSGPSLTATGGDANVPISLAGKGTGAVNLGQATSAGVDLLADQPIRDSSGNELLKFTKAATAVNEITVANAATGNGVSIAATGGDANVGLTVAGKGAGTVTVGQATGSVQLSTAITDLVGFHGVAPAVQRAGAAQGVVSATVGADIGAFTDPPSAAEMALLRTFANALKTDAAAIIVLLNELRAAEVEKGLIKGAA